jgi:hypothetical protein
VKVDTSLASSPLLRRAFEQAIDGRVVATAELPVLQRR